MSTPFVLVASTPLDKGERLVRVQQGQKMAFNVTPCIGRCPHCAKRQKLPKSWPKWQGMPFVGSSPTLEVDAAFISTCGETGSTRYLEVVVPKGVEVQVLSGRPISTILV